jgi:hypothetical protein
MRASGRRIGRPSGRTNLTDDPSQPLVEGADGGVVGGVRKEHSPYTLTLHLRFEEIARPAGDQPDHSGQA